MTSADERIKDVRIDANTLGVDLMDGRTITVKKDASTASLSLIRNNDGSIEFTSSGGTKQVILSVSNDGAKTPFGTINARVQTLRGNPRVSAGLTGGIPSELPPVSPIVLLRCWSRSKEEV